MEEQVNRLFEKVWTKFQILDKDKRLMVAVSGIPGSGKTTLASKLAAKINERWQQDDKPASSSSQDHAPATFLPMDGFHLSRAQLSAMPDPETAHARRGAAFTFDAASFLQLVQKLRKPITDETGIIYAPSFDHAVKDPVADDIAIPPTSRVVVFEGNYLSFGSGASEWRAAAELMDELWFIHVEEDVARRRLIRRHVASGIASNEEDAAQRADENDLVNGREIIEHRLQVDELIHSRADGNW